MSAAEHEARTPAPHTAAEIARGITMRDLLASCGAARAVSTPPVRRAGARAQRTTTT
ncbi:hypothetical protein [Streptomyces sp. SID5785]|uniref:hypothetical protein n=1 Tax=Streptomyces sp. SID5785 TaxID=2690309 RepID=UPI001928AA7D|nr:hypothetical protein [Streptomyces sp. SID5785]